MLSIYDDEQSVVSAIRSGASGYVLKKASGSDLLKAIKAVANAGSYLSSQVSDRMFQRIKKTGARSEPGTAGLEVLAPRELQVFWLVAAGNASKEIAVILELRLGTVRRYRMTMMKKLGVNSIVGVIQHAVAGGMVFPNGLVTHSENHRT
jgi:DNA-binding NarL/FixJ family response regulator